MTFANASSKHDALQELPVHTPQPAAPVTGMPFTASTEYDNQYLPKSLTFNQIGTYGNPASMGNSNGHMQKLPTISSETTNQHFYPYWGVATPQKKGYAVRRISAAPALDFAGDTFTTTNAVEYQPKPSSYVRPTGTTPVCITCPVSVDVTPSGQAIVHTTHTLTCKRQPWFLSSLLSMGQFYLSANRNAAASADLTQAASMKELQVQHTCCKHQNT